MRLGRMVSSAAPAVACGSVQTLNPWHGADYCAATRAAAVTAANAAAVTARHAAAALCPTAADRRPAPAASSVAAAPAAARLRLALPPALPPRSCRPLRGCGCSAPSGGGWRPASLRAASAFATLMA